MPSRYNRVLLNLIRNATEAFPQEFPQSRHLMIRTCLNAQNVVATVEDNGIAVSDTENIFEAFVTTKEKRPWNRSRD